MIRQYDDLRMVNCAGAGCGAELLGESEREFADSLSGRLRSQLPRLVHGSINGRPYCRTCFDEKIAAIKRRVKCESK